MNIYNDIATRTNGDIYIGVVGPVRTGKSTFVARMMENLVLPKIKNKNARQRAIDELPQSADGKTIMTTQPKFVPNEAVKINLGDGIEANVRLIDCVGYLIDGVNGSMENDKPRYVKTPWSNEEMPFEQAAEMGTHKVVADHSTIAVVITNDGTISDIPRANYIPAEERIIDELKQLNKPFVVILNSTTPTGASAIALAQSMSEKHNVSVIPTDVKNMSAKDVNEILSSVLYEFPVRKISMDISPWMRTLPSSNKYITQIIDNVKKGCQQMLKMRDYNKLLEEFADNEFINKPTLSSILMGDGTVKYSIEAKPQLFYKVLSEQSGSDIADEVSLMKYIVSFAQNKNKYERINSALSSCEATGYGVVLPEASELQLLPPEIAKQGNRYGVKLRASAPSLHIMRVDINAEVNPIVGSEQQGQYLIKEYENNAQGLWETNMFGKSMSMLARDSINGKLMSMPVEVQEKLRKTVGKIINDNKGGMICILL